MTRHYVAYTALKRDKAIVTFLTTSSPFQKIKAVFNAAVADMALANSFRLKQCFNQAAKADAPAPLKAAKGFLEALYTRSHSTLRWRAALQIVQKALSHAGWEKAHKNKSLSKYSHSFYKLIDRQIKTEEQNAAALRCHDAFEARLARFTPGLTSAKSREWVAEIVKNKDVLQAQSRKREALYSKLYDKNPLNAAPVITQDMGQRIILKLFKDMGIDETNADIYFSSHPMCFDKNGRAQILLRKDYTNFFDAVLDAVHEGGHALYRINMPDDVRLSMMGLIETNYAGVDEATAMIFDQNLALSKEFAAYLSSLIMSEGKN